MTIRSEKRAKGSVSQEDNLVLWDTYIRSKIINVRSGRGYTCWYWLRDIWDGLNRQTKSKPSLVLQVSKIKKGGYLCEEEKEAVEERVRGEIGLKNDDEEAGF